MKKYRYHNRVVSKGHLRELLTWTFTHYDSIKACHLADELKYLGFKYSSKAGISISVEDLKVPFVKNLMVEVANEEIEQIETAYLKGKMNQIEKFQKIIDIWDLTSEVLKKQVVYYFRTYDPLNSVYIMAFSGARGNISQVRQLVGMRGLMSNTNGESMDLAIQQNFREGLTITDYLMSGYGARKGTIDTALKTANSGYLTRRLIDVGQDILIREKNCFTSHSLLLSLVNANLKKKHVLYEKILGRVLHKEIIDVETKTVIAKKDTIITPNLIEKFQEKNIKEFYIRSLLSCQLYRAICQKCYGWDLANQNLVDIGEAIGILAGQSIGEPGTQLTMRTFHTGGVFTSQAREKVFCPMDGIVKFSNSAKGTFLRNNRGEDVFMTRSSCVLLLVPLTKANQLTKISIPRNTMLFPRNSQFVLKNSVIGEILNKNREVRKDIKLVLNDTSGEIFMPRLRQQIASLTTHQLIWIFSGDVYHSPKNSCINFPADYQLHPFNYIFRTKIVNDFDGFVALTNRKQNLYQQGIPTTQKKYVLTDARLCKFATRKFKIPFTQEVEKSLMIKYFRKYFAGREKHSLNIPLIEHLGKELKSKIKNLENSLLTKPMNSLNSCLLTIQYSNYFLKCIPSRNSKIYLQISPNKKIGRLLTNSFCTLAGGRLYYDYRNFLTFDKIIRNTCISYVKRSCFVATDLEELKKAYQLKYLRSLVLKDLETLKDLKTLEDLKEFDKKSESIGSLQKKYLKNALKKFHRTKLQSLLIKNLTYLEEFADDPTSERTCLEKFMKENYLESFSEQRFIKILWTKCSEEFPKQTARQDLWMKDPKKFLEGHRDKFFDNHKLLKKTLATLIKFENENGKSLEKHGNKFPEIHWAFKKYREEFPEEPWNNWLARYREEFPENYRFLPSNLITYSKESSLKNWFIIYMERLVHEPFLQSLFRKYINQLPDPIFQKIWSTKSAKKFWNAQREEFLKNQRSLTKYLEKFPNPISLETQLTKDPVKFIDGQVEKLLHSLRLLTKYLEKFPEQTFFFNYDEDFFEQLSRESLMKKDLEKWEAQKSLMKEILKKDIENVIDQTSPLSLLEEVMADLKESIYRKYPKASDNLNSIHELKEKYEKDLKKVCKKSIKSLLYHYLKYFKLRNLFKYEKKNVSFLPESFSFLLESFEEEDLREFCTDRQSLSLPPRLVLSLLDLENQIEDIEEIPEQTLLQGWLKKQLRNLNNLEVSLYQENPELVSELESLQKLNDTYYQKDLQALKEVAKRDMEGLVSHYQKTMNNYRWDFPKLKSVKSFFMGVFPSLERRVWEVEDKSQLQTISYRTIIWVTQEVHSVNCEPKSLLVKEGDFIFEKCEFIPNVFSKTSGIVAIEEKNKIFNRIFINSGFVHKGENLQDYSKKMYYPGEIISSSISIEKLSVCQYLIHKNIDQLLVQPIEIFEVPYLDQSNFRVQKELNPDFEIKGIYSYRSHQTIEIAKNLSLVKKYLFLKTEIVSDQKSIELVSHTKTRLVSLWINEKLNLNSYLIPNLRYKNIKSCKLVQPHQFIDKYTVLAYFEARPVRLLKIVKFKINPKESKEILLISEQDCFQIEKKRFPDNNLNDLIIDSESEIKRGKIISEKNTFFVLQKGTPYFFPNCINSYPTTGGNLQYKIRPKNKNQSSVKSKISQEVALNRYSMKPSIRQFRKKEQTHKKLEFLRLFFKKNRNLYCSLMPEFFSKKISIRKSNSGLKSNFPFLADSEKLENQLQTLQDQNSLTTKPKRQPSQTLLLQSSDRIKNKHKKNHSTNFQLTFVQFRENRNSKINKALGIYSITEDYFGQETNDVFCHRNQFLEKGEILGFIRLEKEIGNDIVQGLPKIEEILEARKKNTTLTRIPSSQKEKRLVQKTSLDPTFEFIKLGTPIQQNERINVHRLLSVYFNYYGSTKYFTCDKSKLVQTNRLLQNYESCHQSFKQVQLFMLQSVQSIYEAQGVFINDKHLELIIKQITTKVLITSAGASGLLKNEVIDLYHISHINRLTVGKKPAYYIPFLMGISKAALNNPSFISAASFQETASVLTKAAVEGKRDWLRGLKENIVVGHLLPAGTGHSIYGNAFKKHFSNKNKFDLKLDQIKSRKSNSRQVS